MLPRAEELFDLLVGAEEAETENMATLSVTFLTIIT